MKFQRFTTDPDKKEDEVEQVFNWLRLTEDEAISVIHSLTSQLQSRSPNVGRAEYTTTNGEYFTIAVMTEGVDR